ncbi:hypothetical protein Trydic_g12841 [Trypoxylus dichotomus]
MSEVYAKRFEAEFLCNHPNGSGMTRLYTTLNKHAIETIALAQTPTGALRMGTRKYRQRLDECGVYGRIFFLNPGTDKQNVDLAAQIALWNEL